MADSDYSVKAIISAETSKFEKGMKEAQNSLKKVSTSIQGVSNLLKSAFSVVGITASVGAVVNFGKQAVSSANEANEQFNILNNTIKATGASTWTTIEEMDELAKQYAKTTNYSVTEVERMQSVLLGFKNITDDMFVEASDAIMDMATVMGMDLTNAVQTVGKALDDPVRGLDSLRRQGFAFTDEQKEELAQLVENGEQIKAQKIILDELATTYGGASKAGQSAFAQLQHQMDAFRENVGNKLMPAINEITSNMGKLVNEINDWMNSVEFDKFVAVITNLKNIVKNILTEIGSYFGRVFTEIKGIVTSVNFSPFIKLLDTLLGIIKRLIEEMKASAKKVEELFSRIKNKVDDATQVVNVDKIVNVINTVIDVVWFLRDELQKVTRLIRDLVVNTIGKIWEKIKELFNKSNETLSQSETNIKSWGDFFYKIFNTVFKIVQNLINSIKALLEGKWEVAWEQAKLAVMRVFDGIFTSISTTMNAFPNVVNKIIDGLNKIIEDFNKVREFFGDNPLDLIGKFESVDLSEKSGLNELIQETEKKIVELTGKSADIALNELKGISSESAGLFNDLTSEITSYTDTVEDETGNQKTYFQSTFNDIEETGVSAIEKMSEWDVKLLNQRLDDLKEYSSEYHDIQLKLIDIERKKAIEADKGGKNLVQINKYYNNLILNEYKRYDKAIIERTKEVAKNMSNAFGKVVSNVTNIFRNVFSTVGNFLGKIKSAGETGVDEMLNSLLEFEDGILTFFVEVLPKLPQYVSSAFESIKVLIQSISTSVNFDSLFTNFATSFSDVFNELPKVVHKAMELISKFISIMTENLSQNMGEIFTGIGNSISEVINTVPSIIENLITLVSSLLGEGLPSLLDVVSESIMGLFDKLPNILEEGIPKLLNGIFAFIESLFKNAGKIATKIINKLPEILISVINGIIKWLSNLSSSDITKFINSIVKMVGDIASAIIKNIGKLVGELIPAMVKLISELILKIPDILGGVVSGAWEGIKSLGTSVVEGAKSVVSGIGAGIQSAVSGIGDFFGKLFTGKLFADGTQSAPRGLAIVGEQGPELVKFRGGEQVINNHNTQKALADAGGTTINQSVTFNNLQDTTAYAMMQQLRQFNRELSINGIF